MTRLYVNNFKTTINGAINNSVTTIVLTSATGLPTITGSDYYHLTLYNDTSGTYECVKVTARTGTSLTVDRGVDGTTAVSWVDGSNIDLRANAASFTEKQDALSGASLTSATVATGDLVLIQDVSDSNNLKTVTTQAVANLVNTFGTISVSGQSDVVSDQNNDTLTFVAGTNMTITTNASTDTITFTSSGGGGGVASIAGTANEIDAVDGGGGNYTIGIVDNPTIGGTAGMVIPGGTTAQRGSTNLQFRYNSDLGTAEIRRGGSWSGGQFLTDGLFSSTGLMVRNGALDYATLTAAQGDLIYGSATGVWSSLAKNGSGTRFLSNQGTSNNPSWRVFDYSTDGTGTLAVTNGGTGVASLTQGDLLYASASNTISALAKNASSTRYLSNTGSSNNPAWAQVALTTGVSGILPVANGGSGAGGTSFKATLSSNQTVSNLTLTKIQCNSEEYDVAGTYDNATNYRHTPTVAGKYHYTAFILGTTNVSNSLLTSHLFKNGTGGTRIGAVFSFYNVADTIYTTLSADVSMNGTTDYIELYVLLTGVTVNSGTSLAGFLIEAN